MGEALALVPNGLQRSAEPSGRRRLGGSSERREELEPTLQTAGRTAPDGAHAVAAMRRTWADMATPGHGYARTWSRPTDRLGVASRRLGRGNEARNFFARRAELFRDDVVSNIPVADREQHGDGGSKVVARVNRRDDACRTDQA